MKEFNLSEYLQDKSRKVVTRDGREVRILCIDFGVRESQPILVEITCSRNTKVLEYYNIDGTTQDKNLNLFFADEEDELTEFEKEVSTLLTDIVYDYESEQDLCDNEYVRNVANKLLELVRKELEKENSEFKPKFTYNEKDYSELANKLIEFRNNTPLCSVSYRDGEGRKLILHYEKEITDLARKEILEEFRSREELFYKNGFERGRESILKGMPKWKNINQVQAENHYAHIANGIINPSGYFISYDDLETLPKEG